MPDIDYSELKRTLNLEVAIDWLLQDVNDDFFPDPIYYAEIKEHKADYIAQRQHRFLQIDSVQHGKEFVPKKNLMLREAIWLHPIHRLLYLAILRHLFQQLDPKLLPCSYSYRCDRGDNQDDYPFRSRTKGWTKFRNDFRSAALDPSAGAILATDLASYYDHISCEQMCQRVHSLLGSTISSQNQAVLNLLKSLLDTWSNDCYGIPQNHDPSSFFGSLYLHNVDHEMSALEYRYFRYVDDIRVVTQTKEKAIKGLHDLQHALSKHRLFLASDKTHIYTKDDPEFKKMLDVEDDKFLSEAERTIKKGHYEEISALVEKLFMYLQKHSDRDGDERKFRAYLNRLLSAAEYKEIRQNIIPKLYGFVIPRLESHPERSDYWVKSLRVDPTVEVANILEELLIYKPSIFDWQRFHLWRLALYLGSLLPSSVLNKAIQAANQETSDAVASQAIICVGKYGNNTEKESLFRNHFTTQRSYLIQRAILIAIQELPISLRDSLYQRSIEINSDHRQLVQYLKTIEEPNYGTRVRPTKCCVDVPIELEPEDNDGIGLIDGVVVRFPLSSDYENY